ncbi:MAG: trypsin-like peptidase domain-containing protein [Saprospiraceae bacterium]|nr:trypsin-like peptidase domain-containing protein [Saprospiraceae bacterium]
MLSSVKISFQTILISLCISCLSVYVYHTYLTYNNNQKINEEKNRLIRVAQEELFLNQSLAQLFRSTAPTSFIEAAKLGRESVVAVKSRNSEENDLHFNSRNNGSGVVISSDGYIVTNHHVIGSSDKIEVTLPDKRTMEAKLIGIDKNTDLALLKIEVTDLPFLIMGNSDSLMIGEWVLAVGNPFELQSTVTAGIVGAKARSINIMENQGIESFIQTDAAVNPGSSGGALINTAGHLVGINTAIMSEKGTFEGFSFAIPINVVKKIISDLKEYGVVQRGWMGIDIENLDDRLAGEIGLSEIKGVYISYILKDGAAQDAGIKKGDVILQVNKNQVNTTSEFMENLTRYRPGEKIETLIWRSGKKMNISVTLKNHLNSLEPVGIYKSGILEKIGIEVRNLDGVEHSLFGKSGVLVLSIKKGGIVYHTKMEPGFIIQSMDNKMISSVQQLITLLEENIGNQIVWEGIYKNYPGTYPYTFKITK